MGGGDFDGDYEFAYQLIGGVAYDVNAKFSITTEVRYFGISEQDLENDFSISRTSTRPGTC